MDITIRNLQGDAYREAKARAALEGKTVGEVVSEVATFDSDFSKVRGIAVVPDSTM